MKWFKKKRQQVAKALPKNSLLVLASAPEVLRQPDVSYPYRQASNFYYLTGFVEASSLFILIPNKRSHKSILFIPDKNPTKETWDGVRYTTKEVKKQFLIDEVFYLADLDKKLGGFLKKKSQIYYNQNNSYFNRKISQHSRKKTIAAQSLLAAFREIKDSKEVSWIQKACEVTAHAHQQIALNLKPKMPERTLHGIFLKSIMEKGSVREGYGSIVACGNNATTLHYIKNNSICKSGELLLVDAGAEMHYYTADVTRVYPVSGKFLKNQKKVYSKLLKLQKELIQSVRPGISMRFLNEKMEEGISKILEDLHLLPKSKTRDKILRKYSPHSVGHLLGLDVHDPYTKNKKNLILKKGMVLTIEPGIYFSKNDTLIPKDLKGAGFRIEDNILVTSSGYKVLTHRIPKEVKDIERLCSKKV